MSTCRADVLRAGGGLALVNVGYVALLSFGAQAVSAGGGCLVATFGATVVAVRGLGGGLPDRLGAAPVLVAAAPAEAAGLAALVVMPNTATVLGGTMVLAAGQAVAVPALGMHQRPTQRSPDAESNAGDDRIKIGYTIGANRRGSGCATDAARRVTPFCIVELRRRTRSAAGPLRPPDQPSPAGSQP